MAAGVLLSGPMGPTAFAQGGDGADRISVMRENDRSFRIARAESVEVLVTFLSPTTFRVRIVPEE